MPATKRQSTGSAKASSAKKQKTTSTPGRVLNSADTNTPKKPGSTARSEKDARHITAKSPLAAKNNAKKAPTKPASTAKDKQTKKPTTAATAKSSGTSKPTHKNPEPEPEPKSKAAASKNSANKPGLCTSPSPSNPDKLNTGFIPEGYVEFWTPNEKSPGTSRVVPSLFRKPEKSYAKTGACVSHPAYGRLCDMYNNCVHATPEANGIIHIFEDYRGYGIIEVIMHEIAEYQKIASKKEPDVRDLWIRAEALALFFAGDDNTEWLSVDDGEKVGDMLHLFAWLFLDALSRLQSEHLAGIENLGLVCGSMASAIGMCEDAYEEQEEIWRLEDWAQTHAIEMKIVRAKVQSYEREPRDTEDRYSGKDDWQAEFGKVFRAFKKKHGGQGFGKITMGLQNLTKAEKKKMNSGEVGSTWIFTR